MTVADTSPEYWQEYGQFQQVKHDLIKRYLGGWFPKLGTWAGRVLYVDTMLAADGMPLAKSGRHWSHSIHSSAIPTVTSFSRHRK